MRKSLLMLLALLCLFLTNCKKEVTVIPDPPIEEIDPKITAFTDSLTLLYQDSILPGFAVTVIKGDEIYYQEAFGQANVANDIKYTNQTLQPIGSISKTFIAAALMKAIEQGHFTLETEINSILPFEVINPNISADLLEPIKIKHLVTHSAGFEDSDDAYDSNYYIKTGESTSTPMSQLLLSIGIEVSDGIALGDYVQAVYSPEGAFYDADNYIAAPGKVYEYSNITASLAAYVIEAKTGKSFASYVKKHIFDPLGMDNSGYDRSLLDQSKLAALYISRDYPMPEYSHPSYPDGFVNTSNEDLSKYLIEMMHGAAGKGSILSKESYKTLFTRQSPIGFQGHEVHAVFWDLVGNRIEHGGSDPGVFAHLSFDPITNTGYLMLANINESGLGEPFGINKDLINGQLRKLWNKVKEFEKR